MNHSNTIAHEDGWRYEGSERVGMVDAGYRFEKDEITAEPTQSGAMPVERTAENTVVQDTEQQAADVQSRASKVLNGNPAVDQRKFVVKVGEYEPKRRG